MKTDLIISILAGLATAIPLVIKLVEYVRKAVKEKNWTSMLQLLMKLMEQAETNFTTGAARKKWVMSEIEAAAKIINYDIDLQAISALIDSLCDMTKNVNGPRAPTEQ